MKPIAIIAVVLALAAPASAQDRAAIRSFPIATIEKLGREIARQDQAAWVATDALIAKVGDIRSTPVRGWIVEPRGDGQRVRFLRQAGAAWEAAYDVDVTADFKTSLSEPSDRRLDGAEQAMWTARQTALAGAAGLQFCRQGYNTVVAKDPERDGWLVWLLAPQPKANTYAIGGHYRFSISADGKSVLQRDALSASCMVMDPSQGVPAGSKPAGMGVSHIVSPTPVETHVFVALQSRLFVTVGAGDRVWFIENGSIRDGGPISARRP